MAKHQGAALVATALIFSLRNDRFDTVPAQPSTYSGATVALVAGHSFGAPPGTTPRLGDAHRTKQRFKIERFMPLPRTQANDERQALAVHHQVQLGGKATARAAQRMIYRLARAVFFRAPAAARLALTTEPSMQNNSQSIGPRASMRACNRSSTRSQTPSRHQWLKRVYTVSQGPYRSGRSRQGAPVRRIHTIPFQNNFQIEPSVLSQ